MKLPREHYDNDFDQALDDDCLAEITAMVDLPPDLVNWLQDQRDTTGVCATAQIRYAVAMMRQAVETVRGNSTAVVSGSALVH